MADPVTLAITGAVAGAALNRKDPLKGALIGGTLGYGGGMALGPAVGASAPGVAGAAGTAGGIGTKVANAAYGALPGMQAGGQQAAMLAAQTGQFGVPGLLSTGAAASGAQGISPVAASMFNFGAKASLPSASGSQMQQLAMANNMMRPQQPQQQAMAPPPMPISRPQGARYPTLEEMRQQQMMAQAAPRFSLL